MERLSKRMCNMLQEVGKCPIIIIHQIFFKKIFKKNSVKKWSSIAIFWDDCMLNL